MLLAVAGGELQKARRSGGLTTTGRRVSGDLSEFAPLVGFDLIEGKQQAFSGPQRPEAEPSVVFSDPLRLHSPAIGELVAGEMRPATTAGTIAGGRMLEIHVLTP
jgi:hypothetical protein